MLTLQRQHSMLRSTVHTCAHPVAQNVGTSRTVQSDLVLCAINLRASTADAVAGSSEDQTELLSSCHAIRRRTGT
jgi:hypothetical protein